MEKLLNQLWLLFFTSRINLSISHPAPPELVCLKERIQPADAVKTQMEKQMNAHRLLFGLFQLLFLKLLAELV